MKQKPIFSIIYHSFRIKNDLSMNEYVLCDMIYHLSNNKNSTVNGWCFASKQHLADTIGISKRATFDMIKRLLSNNFLEINEENNQLLRTSSKWEKVYLTNSLQFGEETSPSAQKNTKNKLTSNLQIGEETSPTIQNLHHEGELDTENDRAEFAHLVKKLPISGEETSPYIYSYSNIKYSIYNSLKEKENFEKKSEIIFIDGVRYFLSKIMETEKFKSMSKYFLDLDNRIMSAICLPEVSVSDYDKESNLSILSELIYTTSIKIGNEITNETEIKVLAESILANTGVFSHFNWSEVCLAMEMNLSQISHPLATFIEEMEQPTKFSLHFFSKSIKIYTSYRNHVYGLIRGIKGGFIPYKIEDYKI